MSSVRLVLPAKALPRRSWEIPSNSILEPGSAVPMRSSVIAPDLYTRFVFAALRRSGTRQNRREGPFSLGA